jgi:hypothetical protein
MGLDIKNPDEFDLIFIGGKQLQEGTADMVADGKAKFFGADSDEAKHILEDHPELLQGDLALVASPDSEDGEACVISAIGKSLIVHCEDFVIPVKD